MIQRQKKKIDVIEITDQKERERSQRRLDEVARRFVSNSFPLCALDLYANEKSKRFCARINLDRAREMGLTRDDVANILREFPEVHDRIFGRPARPGRPTIRGLLS